MGRKAAITYEQVKAVIEALRAEGAKPTVDRVWEALGKSSSKGTVHKLVKQYLGELTETQKTPENLRPLPVNVQQVILAFADQAATMARDVVEDELLVCSQEAIGLATDNERLTAELDEMRTSLEQATAEKASGEGRAAQLANEIVTLQKQLGVERADAENARIALAAAELRLEFLGPVEEELRLIRKECDSQRDARVKAEQAAAVFASRQDEHQERLQELKSSLANAREACNRLEHANRELTVTLERERHAREIAERNLAVMGAIQDHDKDPSHSPKPNKKDARQGDLLTSGR